MKGDLRLLLIALAALLLLGLGIGLGIGLGGRLGAANPTATAVEPAVAALAGSADEAAVEASAPVQSGQAAGGLPAPPTLAVSPTPSAPPTQTPLPSETRPPTETLPPSTTPTPSETPSPTPSQTPTPTNTPTITPTRSGPLAEAAADAGFFAGPGVDFGRLNYYAKEGEVVVLLGRNPNGQWVHVISNANSFEGWVSARFLTLISGDLAKLTVSTFRETPVAAFQPAATRTTGAAGTASGTAWFAFLEGSGRGNGDGTWSGDLLVQVPTGFTYSFELDGAASTRARRTKENEAGQDEYILTLTASCGGTFVGNLRVRQNGAPLPVRHLYTGEAVAVYIPVDCS